MLKVKIDSRAWLAKEGLTPQQLHSLRRALTVRPFNGYIADAEDVEPIPLYVETDRLFGVPRAFYLEKRKQKNDELLMVSSGEPMRELETKMRFTGPFAGQVEAIERMVGYTEENEWGGFVLEAGCGWGKCVREDTMIATPTGMTKIGSIVSADLDDEAVSCDSVFACGPDGAERSVSHLYAKRSAPCLRIKTESGFELSGTHVHPVRVLRAGEFVWVKMRDLQVGDAVVYRRGWIREDAGVVTPDDAYLAGLITGNGSCTQGSVRFSSVDEEVRSEFKRIVASHGHACIEYGKCDITVARGHTFFKKLRGMGLVDSSNAHRKKVPTIIASGGKSAIRMFLRGYFDTDGDARLDTCTASITSVGRELLVDVQLLLLGLGVRSSLYRKRGRYNGEPHFSWRLMIYREDLGAFAQEVGFGLTRKQAVVDASGRGGVNPNKWLIPVASSMRRFLSENDVTGKSKWKNYTHLGCAASPAKLREFIDFYGLNEDPFWAELLNEDLLFERIRSIEDDGVHRVCDLTVPDGHAYIAAGCVVHNTNVALEFARRVGRRTLIIVHKEFFVEQWRKRILEFMPDARVGVIQADRCEYADCDFVIGMMQSLANDAMDKYPYDMFSSFGLIMSDEVHRIGAKTWANVISLFNARYRVGLTATLRRKDRCEDVIFHHIGPVLYTAKGEAMVPVVRTVQTDFRLAPVLQRGKWIDVEKLMPVQVVTQIVSDQSRNRQIAEVVAEQVLKGRKVMVVSERLEHLKVLSGNIASVLLAYDSDLPFEPVIDYYTGEWFSGDIDRKTGQRKKRTRTAEERDKAESANVIMATRQMMEEGLDISAVDVLVLATPISDVEQTIGRVRRFCTPSKSKCERLCPWRAGECQGKPEPIVIDVVDRHVRRIVRKFEERRVFYEKIGSEVDGQQRLLRKLV